MDLKNLSIFGMLIVLGLISALAFTNEKKKKMTYNTLTEKEKYIILEKGTEPPFSGKYVNHKKDGTFTCKQCGQALFKSSAKFDSKSGWPSFDDAIKGAVKEIPDKDGYRTEIVCSKCGGHLGHVFKGEHFTAKNTRHCVNSLSLNFKPAKKDDANSSHLDTAIFAGGCFWGVEFFLQKANGVIKTEVGYTGGKVKNPTYKQVSYTNTGHIEAVKVVFDKTKTSFETLTKLFFEIHDPTQKNKQGPDIGRQYASAIFYNSAKQKETSEKLIKRLKKKGYNVVTELIPAQTFWSAEEYHQDYYEKKKQTPYCHQKNNRFE